MQEPIFGVLPGLNGHGVVLDELWEVARQQGSITLLFPFGHWGLRALTQWGPLVQLLGIVEK